MALIKNQKLNNLDNIVAPISQGLPFRYWAETKAQELVDNVLTKKNVVNLARLLRSRKIIINEIVSSHGEEIFKARIIVKNDGFEMILAKDQIINELEKRFIIAHEIAHTLFYTHDDNEYKRDIILSYGSSQIEDICDFIALCILLPKKYINTDIDGYLSQNTTLRQQNENYLKFVYFVSAKYQVDWHHVAFRFINILDFLPNMLCIEFVKRSDWRIKWSFQSESLSDKNLFIPLRNKANKNFPPAKESFSIILDKILSEHRNYSKPCGSTLIDKNHFHSFYQGNIKQFIEKNFTDKYDKIKIYYRINRMDNVILLFPFNGLLK